MALTTSLRAPLDEGDVWLLALLWAYILPPLGVPAVVHVRAALLEGAATQKASTAERV